MTLSSGSRRAIAEGAVWLGVFAWCGLGVYYFKDITDYVAERRLAHSSARPSEDEPQPQAARPLSIQEQELAEARAQARALAKALEQAQADARAQARLSQVRAGSSRGSDTSDLGRRTVTLRANEHGQFGVTADINGSSIDVLVDTGATFVALTWNDARSAGISVRDSDFTQTVSTANGQAKVAPVTLDRLSVGTIELYNVQALVARPGQLSITLLGMSFLRRTNMDFRGRDLVLSPQ